MVEISTSILSVKKEESIQKFYELEVAHTDYFHIDVMDGMFVPKDTRKEMLEYATNIKQISNIPLDVHFMVQDVQKEIENYIPLEPNIITFHYEAANSKEQVTQWIDLIKQNNSKVGIAIKPATPVEDIYEFLPYLHMVLIMTVEPGKGGQTLIPETIEKIEELHEYCKIHNLEIDIQADGGIGEDNIRTLEQKGLNIAVAGSAIINSSDYKQTIQKLKG